jgi:hypothetical protein
MQDSVNKIVLLPGNSKSNKSWIKSVQKAIRNDYKKVYTQFYKHWELNEKLINLEREMKILCEEIQGWDQYLIFAKSAGTLLALQAIEEYEIRPSGCLFAGFPYSFGQRLGVNVKKLLKDIQVPLKIVQQKEDPAIHADDLQEILGRINNSFIELITIKGESHYYGDLDLLKKHILELNEEITNEG